MPCTDITEMVKLNIDAEEKLIDFISIKKTCGKNIFSDAIANEMKNKEIVSILEEPFLATNDLLNRKIQITLKSTIAAYLGLPPFFNHVNTEIIGIQTEKDSVEIMAQIHLDVPVEEITPCAKGCGSCSSKK